MDRVVVIGASLAGLRTAEALRRLGFEGHLTLVGDEPHPPYDRPPLSKSYLTAGPAPGEPDTLCDERHLRTTLDVRLVLGSPARHLDTDRREVHVGAQVIRYDRVVIATGVNARALPPSLLPSGVGGVHSLRTHHDALAVRGALDAGGAVVVIGAGFIGSEVASAARGRDLPVTVVEREATPLTRSLGADVGRLVSRIHLGAGTDLRCGVSVTSIAVDRGRVRAVHLGDGSVLPADLLIAATGAAPATGWLKDSGVRLHPVDGGVLCGADLATGTPGVYAAGDVAHVPHPLVDGRHLRLEHWTNAAEHGTLVARSLLGVTEPPLPPSVPYFWSDLYGERVQFVGVPDADETVTLGEGGRAPVALYRRDDRVVGALLLNRPRAVMKFRRRIAEHAPWTEALDSARALVAGDEPSNSPARSNA